VRFSLLLFITAALAVSPVGAMEFPDVEGWIPSGEPSTYDPSNLWKLIDGAAEQFLSYDFQLLRSRDLSSGDLIVTVNIYDMKTPLNAFGIYSVQRPDARKKLPIGAEAVVTPPYQCLLLKNRFYVIVDAYQGEINEATGENLLKGLAEVLPGPDGLPDELELLPSRGKVTGSEGFAREGFLGLSDLKNCVHSRYIDSKGREYPVFVMIPGRDESTGSIWEKLAAGWKPLEGRQHPVLFRKIPYRGLAGITLTDRGIFGVSGAADENALLEELESIIR